MIKIAVYEANDIKIANSDSKNKCEFVNFLFFKYKNSNIKTIENKTSEAYCLKYRKKLQIFSSEKTNKNIENSIESLFLKIFADRK